jgi:hypothetical protein
VPRLPGPQFGFERPGKSGAWISDRLPWPHRHADKLCIIESMQISGFDHHKRSFPFQGLNQKRTGVKPAKVVKQIVA